MARIKDYYKILGVPTTAQRREILAARNRLLKEYHPDHNPDPAARERTVEILLASEVLLDALARAEYDRMHRNVFGSAKGERPGAAPAPEPPPRRGPMVTCPQCGHKNATSQRGYCIFCGAGIGADPSPFDLGPIRDMYERLRIEKDDREWDMKVIMWSVFGGCLVLMVVFMGLSTHGDGGDADTLGYVWTFSENTLFQNAMAVLSVLCIMGAVVTYFLIMQQYDE